MDHTAAMRGVADFAHTAPILESNDGVCCLQSYLPAVLRRVHSVQKQPFDDAIACRLMFVAFTMHCPHFRQG